MVIWDYLGISRPFWVFQGDSSRFNIYLGHLQSFLVTRVIWVHSGCKGCCRADLERFEMFLEQGKKVFKATGF